MGKERNNDGKAEMESRCGAEHQWGRGKAASVKLSIGKRINRDT